MIDTSFLFSARNTNKYMTNEEQYKDITIIFGIKADQGIIHF